MAKKEMHSEKGEMKKDIAQDKALIKKAFKQHDKQEHKGSKGTNLSKLKKGGVPDLDAAGRAVLQDWVSGRISFYTLPPTDRAYIVHDGAIFRSGTPEVLANDDDVRFFHERIFAVNRVSCIRLSNILT